MKIPPSKSAEGNSSGFPAYPNGRIVLRILLLITFAFVFIFHTFPLGLSDFWWHMNTGRWIWDHGGLPSNDPFLYSSISPLDVRAKQILHGYPLFQLLIFGVYTWSGAYALVVLKGLLMTLFYVLLWNHLRRNGMNSALALAIVGALPLLFFRFDDFRPQIFTFIFTLLVLQLIEYILENERRGIATKLHVMLSLPFIMLLWANLHGGFIVGMAILAVYLLAEWLARKRGSKALSDQAFRRLMMVTILSVAASCINPAGISAIWSIFSVMSGPFSKVIDEYFGTIQYFDFHGIKHIGYLIVAIAVIPAIALFYKWREISMPHLLLTILFLMEGILSFRFSLLMAGVVIVIASSYYSQDLNRWFGAFKGIPIALLWCLSIIFLANAAISRTSLSGTALETAAFPTPAVKYLERSRPAGNIFNFFEYGGYLGWELYPQKIFTDQRGLSWDTYEEYSRCWRGDYSGVFQKYQVGTVLYPVYEGPLRNKLSRLVAGLFNDNQWGVGYYDGRDIVFLKMGVNDHLPMLDKQRVAADIIRRSRG